MIRTRCVRCGAIIQHGSYCQTHKPAHQADQLRKQAYAHQQQRDTLLSQARQLERDAGIPAPCHLCGHRDCQH